jgi:hypothetical protein
MKISRNLILLFSSTALASVLLNIAKGYSNAEEKYSDLKKIDVIKVEKITKYNQPYFTSQLVTPTYDCKISSEQTNSSPPTMNYRSSLTCSVGKPVSFVLTLRNSNVNFPDTQKYIGPNNFSCPPASLSCSTPNYSRVIDKTQHLWIYSGVNILGSNGLVYTVPNGTMTIRTYNNRGSAYPLIKPTRSDMSVVPFPVDPPYVDSVPRDDGFRTRLEQLYGTNNWVIPSDSQAHHIKPLAWGGSNDVQTNGVFLGTATHNLFTSWWANFSNLNW